jgi:hypothetical protein
MESVKAEAVAGERKAVTSDRSRFRETTKGCGALEGIEPGGGENAIRGADRRAHGARKRKAQNRACRLRVGLGIGSLGTFFIFELSAISGQL